MSFSRFRRLFIVGFTCSFVVILFQCRQQQNPVSSSQTSGPAKIGSFGPSCAHVGGQIVITGENFDSTKTGDTVFFFHGATLALIDSATATKIYARVPVGTATGPIIVAAGAFRDTSKTNFSLDSLPSPTLTDFNPKTGALGTIVTITGTNFDTVAGHTVVTMGNAQEKIVSITKTQIVVEIVLVNNSASMPLTVSMDCDQLTTSSSFSITQRNETITSFTPVKGKVGSQVTITGVNFNPDMTGLVVTFGNVPAQVISVSSTQIIAVVPQGAVTAPISVSFFGEKVTSATTFQVEGKWQFDSCYVEMGNVPTRMYHNLNSHIVIDTTNLNFANCALFGSLNDSLSSKDTLMFVCANNYNSMSSWGSCSCKLYVVIDTSANVFQSVIQNINSSEHSPYNGTKACDAEGSSSITLTSIQFASDSVYFSGSGMNKYFLNGNYSYSKVCDGDYTELDSILQFLPFTDSSYIRIVLK